MEEGNTTQRRGTRKRILIVATLCILVGTGVVALLLGARQPQHNGKTLSAWVDICFSPTTYLEQTDAVAAIQAIGPRALPWLLGWAHYETPPWQTKLAEHFKRVGFNWPTRFLNQRNRLHDLAWPTLSLLGRRADSAIPDIERIALNSASPQEAECAMNFLSQRPEGVPALLRIIAQGKVQRLRAIHYINQVPNLGTNGTTAVAVLLNYLKDDDEIVVASAARALGSVALQTGDVVPALTPLLRDSRRDVRSSASSALGNLARHRAAFPALMAALPEFVAAQQSTDYSVRAWATNIIWKIAPDLLTNSGSHF